MEIEDRAITEDDDSDDEYPVEQVSEPETLDYLADSIQPNSPEAEDSVPDEASLADSLAALENIDSESSAPDLDAVNDSGNSDSDNLTNNTITKIITNGLPVGDTRMIYKVNSLGVINLIDQAQVRNMIVQA